MSIYSMVEDQRPPEAARGAQTHKVKSWPQFFEAILDGRKCHEMRRSSERDYQVGDTLHLQEFDPNEEHYTGREQRVLVTYVTSSDYPCALSDGALAEGFCVLSIRPTDKDNADGADMGFCRI